MSSRPVTITIGRSRSLSCARMRSTSSKPFMPGISISIIAMSKISRDRISSAVAPSDANTTSLIGVVR
jgi:hypothetical protein